MKLSDLFKKTHTDTLNTHLLENVADKRDAVIDWILTAPVGSTIVYYVGYLARDRDPVLVTGVWPNMVARLMWFSCSTPKTPAGERHMEWGKGFGLVCLTQKKLETEKYLYRATKIMEVPPELVPAWKSTLRSL